MGTQAPRFAAKTALVTGASSGIGRALSELLHGEGARLALGDVLPNESVQDWEGTTFLPCDVRDPRQVEALVEEATVRFGGLDHVFANAGIVRDGFVSQMTDESWNDVIAVNLTGAFNLCRAAFERIARGGSIVVTSSVSALGNLGQVNYAAAKAGLIGLVRTLALEGASRGLRVNAVAPGFTDTPMVAGVPEKVKTKLLSRVPLSRLARPEEIARAMLFLASDDASYITGQVLFVDGGLSVGL